MKQVVAYTLKELQDIKSNAAKNYLFDFSSFNLYLAEKEFKGLVVNSDPTMPVKTILFSKKKLEKNNILILGKQAKYLRRDPSSPLLLEAYGDIFQADVNKHNTLKALPFYQAALAFGGNAEQLTAKIAILNN